MLADTWWIAPTVVGVGAIGVVGARMQRKSHARTVEHAAAKNDLRLAREQVVHSRAAARVARAELTRVQAEKSAGRAPAASVSAAREAMVTSQREAKSAIATARVARAQVAAARLRIPSTANDPALLPLGRLMADHDAVTARWLEYETDPAKLIAFPAMSDGRNPLMTTFVSARAQAQWLRPEAATTRVSVAEFTAYRNAVNDLKKSFLAAEQAAWRQSRGEAPSSQTSTEGAPFGFDPSTLNLPPWAATATDMVAKSTEFIVRASEKASAAVNAAKAAREAKGSSPDATPKPKDPGSAV